MKLQIVHKKIAAVMLFLAIVTTIHAQSASESNPLEYTAIGAGEAMVDKEIKKQQQLRDTLTVYQTGMLVGQTKMKKWEEKYNAYLKTAQGYASAIKAGCTLYIEGVQTLVALWEIKTACKINPQGIAASVPMNTLYMETAAELIKTYRSLKKVVAKGGEDNMLKGSERTRLLWELNDELNQLNKKFRALALSIGYYTFEDVWNKAIAGKIQKSNKTLAEEALKRQGKAMTLVANFYKERENGPSWVK